MNLLIFNLKTDANDDVLGFTTDWINSLSIYYDNVTVLTMHRGTLNVAKNVTVYSIGKEHGYPKILRVFLFYFYLIKILYKNKIDACFAHMIPIFAIMGWPILYLLNIPIVLWYAHGHASTTLKISEYIVDMIVTSTKGGCNIPSKKVKVLGQGIDTNRFKPYELAKENNTITILTVGRISRIKRINLIIQAFSKIPKHAPTGEKIILHIVGPTITQHDKTYLKELQEYIVQSKKKDYVRFSGSIPFSEIQDIYQNSDIFINLCDSHSLDKALLEAMSCGIPVCTNNPSFQKILTTEQLPHCFIFNTSVQTISNQLNKLILITHDQRSNLGMSLRKEIEENHSIKMTASKINSAILECLNKKKSNPV